MDIEIKSAQKNDAKRLAEVYNLSFYSDFVKYGECPGYNKTEESILSRMQCCEVYKIIANKTIIGAISVSKESDTHYFLGALCVIPEYANQGIGQQAMRFLDKAYPNATHESMSLNQKRHCQIRKIASNGVKNAPNPLGFVRFFSCYPSIFLYFSVPCQFEDTLWALETPADKVQNHCFYKKFGYRVTKEYMDGKVRISFFERER